MAKKPEKPLSDLIADVEKATGLIKDDIAAKLRNAGLECSTSTIYNWARGTKPAANSEPTIRAGLIKIMDDHKAAAKKKKK